MPDMDAGSVNVSIEREVGISLGKTDETFRKAEKIIKEKVPELKSMFT
jgi:multidrug efflux pump subunit AcrB